MCLSAIETSERNQRRSGRLLAVVLLLVLHVGLNNGANLLAQEPIRLDHRWETDPDLGAVWEFPNPEFARAVNINKLQSSLRGDRVAEAQQAILYCNDAGVTNRSEALAAAIEQLETGETNRHLLLALVSAALALAESPEADAGSMITPELTEKLWRIARVDAEAQRIVERKLIQWQSNAAIDVWRERIRDLSAANGDLILAVQGLESAGDLADAASLRELVLDATAVPALRLAAAKAMGVLCRDPSQAGPSETLAEETADQFAATDFAYRDLAIAMLLRHSSRARTGEVLNALLERGSGPAHLVAYEGLAENFEVRAYDLAAELIDHQDHSVRLAAVEVLNRRGDMASLNAMAVALGDRNVHVRRVVRGNMISHAQNPDLLGTVDAIVTSQLASERFEAVEQAILVVDALGQDKRADTLFALLSHPRDEVNVRAAWALKNMRLSPQLLSSIAEHCAITTRRLDQRERVLLAEEKRIAFLFEALGAHAYEAADEMLMMYVPKLDHRMKDITRASAIYALGLIWQGRENQPLVAELCLRIVDNNPLDAESKLVQYTGAVALGRIGDRSSLQALNRVEDPLPLPVGKAAVWAIEQLQNSPE